MIVHSHFNGISCGMVALERAGIPVTHYVATEIDKYAIQVSNKNYPDIWQMGDITALNPDTLSYPDLIMAGSPCQDFSLAGTQKGFDGNRGQLFFEFLKHRDRFPKAKFLLENTRMKKETQDAITKYMGVEPIEINSALVSAQNRKRLYWTNIPGVTQPEDKGILLKDVCFKDVFPVAVSNIYGGFNEDAPRFHTEKSPTLRASTGGGNLPQFIKQDSLDSLVYQFPHGQSKGGVRNLEKSPSLTQQWHNNYFKLIHSEKAIDYMNRTISDGRNHWDFAHHSDILNDKSATVVANFFKGVPYNVLKDFNCIRKFHPIECERLQTLGDNFTEGISDTQRYRCIGNGWNVDTIVHILKGLK